MFLSKRFNFKLALMSIALLFSMILVQCRSDSESGTEPNLTGSGIIKGKVLSLNGSGLSGVTAECNGFSATTNILGEFTLENVKSGKGVLVNFSKTGYSGTQQIVKVVDYKESYTQAALSEIGTIETINSSVESVVSTPGANVVFPKNGFVDSEGNAYNGDVEVHLTYFNPTGEYFYDLFPGEFEGKGLDGEISPIESFGFIDVELFDGDEKLQLKEGSPATITMDIPAAMAGNAPATIPLWFYDTDKGEWIEYGSAEKIGDKYVGEVSHFTKINCDMKYNERSSVISRVVDQDGNLLVNAWITLRGVDFKGGGRGHTGDDAAFEFINVKANSNIKLSAYYGGFNSEVAKTVTAANNAVKDVGDIVIIIDPNLKSGWTKIGPDFPSLVSDIQFINENVGWLVAGSIYKTEDGGASWINQFENFGSSSNSKIDMIDANYGWALLQSRLYNTTSGGETWSLVRSISGITDIIFLDNNNGYLIGYDSYKTTDAGVTWTDFVAASEHWWEGTTAEFISPDIGWIGGYCGVTHKAGAGQSWNIQTIEGEDQFFYDIFFVNATTGWVLPYNYGGSNNVVYMTSDAGETWISQKYESSTNMEELFFTDINNGWIIGQHGIILHTSDGGTSWTQQFNNNTSDLYCSWFINQDVGWIGYGTSDSGTSDKGNIFYTNTGGK